MNYTCKKVNCKAIITVLLFVLCTMVSVSRVFAYDRVYVYTSGDFSLSGTFIPELSNIKHTYILNVSPRNTSYSSVLIDYDSLADLVFYCNQHGLSTTLAYNSAIGSYLAFVQDKEFKISALKTVSISGCLGNADGNVYVAKANSADTSDLESSVSDIADNMSIIRRMVVSIYNTLEHYIHYYSNFSVNLAAVLENQNTLISRLESYFDGQNSGIVFWTKQINYSVSQIVKKVISVDNTVSSFVDTLSTLKTSTSNIEEDVDSIALGIPRLEQGLERIYSQFIDFSAGKTVSDIISAIQSIPSYDDTALLSAFQPVISLFDGGAEVQTKIGPSGNYGGRLDYEKGSFSLVSLDVSDNAHVFFLAGSVSYYRAQDLSFNSSEIRCSMSILPNLLGPTMKIDSDHITITVVDWSSSSVRVPAGTYELRFFDPSGSPLALKAGDLFLPSDRVGVWQLHRASGGVVDIASTSGLPDGYSFADLFTPCVRLEATVLKSSPALFSLWLDYFYMDDLHSSYYRVVSPDKDTVTLRYSVLHPLLAWYAQRQDGFQIWLGNKLDNLPGGSSGSADLSAVVAGIGTINTSVNSLNTDLAANLNSLVDKLQVVVDNSTSNVENVTNVVIEETNNAYNVFYVTTDDGDKKPVGEVAGDTLSASGKLLNFLYKLCFEGALSRVDDSITNMDGFYFDSGAGLEGNIWD